MTAQVICCTNMDLISLRSDLSDTQQAFQDSFTQNGATRTTHMTKAAACDSMAYEQA